MFIRKKQNKSGSTSIQVLEKRNGKNQLLKSIGCSSDPLEIQDLVNLAEDFIVDRKAQLSLLLHESKRTTDWFSMTFSSIQGIRLQGPELVLGKIFDEIGFNKIPSIIFRHLVISRLIFPFSKLKTARYLSEYEAKEYSVDKIYRYLDLLYEKQKETIEQISYEHTLEILGGEISMVFYDVTTIYFESDKEDDLRKTGFSKEGKHMHPQILLGLLVSNGGYPLAYEVFEGNKYEGHTMLPVANEFKKRFNIEKIIIIADAGLLTKNNITSLQNDGYEFILGARIKSESKEIKEQILNLKFEDNLPKVLKKENGLRLVVSYSEKRAKKDKHNRKKGLSRLEKKVAKGKLTKSQINNRGYNKYLTMDGQLSVKIDYEKFKQDAKWDGLKGYVSNTKLSPNLIIQNYRELWKIEKAFRISKTDLKIRPIYHRLERRIKSHICLSFAAYKVYKELERQLLQKKVPFSVERSIELLKTIYGITLQHPATKKVKLMTYTNTEDQEILLKYFGIENG